MWCTMSLKPVEQVLTLLVICKFGGGGGRRQADKDGLFN